MNSSLLKCVALCTVVVTSSGCYWQVSNIRQPTVGSQLMDLQKARDAGSLTDAEYQAQKTRVLNGK